jgi:hypothetical protein
VATPGLVCISDTVIRYDLDKVPAHVGRPILRGVEGIVHTADKTLK